MCIDGREMRNGTSNWGISSGSLYKLIEKGVIQSWINRLKEIDEKGEL